MPASSANQITQLLLAWSEGEETAREELVPLVYAELHRLARRYMRRERRGHTLQTTALVNEAYLRLVGAKDLRLQNRAHFFALSANLMKNILVDFARSRRNLKHGGDGLQVSLDEDSVVSIEPSLQLIELDEALERLKKLNARQAEIIEMRYFGGLKEEEIAEVLRISLRTVQNDWRLARLWLYRELKSGGAE